VAFVGQEAALKPFNLAWPAASRLQYFCYGDSEQAVLSYVLELFSRKLNAVSAPNEWALYYNFTESHRPKASNVAQIASEFEKGNSCIN